MSTDNTKLAYTVEEAVAASGMSRATLYKLHAQGRLAMRKAGRRTLILAADLKDLIDKLPALPRHNEVAAPGEPRLGKGDP